MQRLLCTTILTLISTCSFGFASEAQQPDNPAPMSTEARECFNLHTAIETLEGVNPRTEQGSQILAAIASCKIIARAVVDKDLLGDVPGIVKFDDIKSDNTAITPATAAKLTDLVDNGLKQLQADRVDDSKKRFIRGCMNQSGGILSKLFDECAVRKSNTPGSLAASEAALFSFTRDFDANKENGKQKTFYSIASAFRGDRGIDGKTAMDFGIEYHRNNKIGKQQDNLNINLGLVRDIYAGYSTRDVANALINQVRPANITSDYSSLRFEGGVSYNRKGIYGDPKSDPCQAMPDAKFCGKQILESARFTGFLSPYLSSLNSSTVVLIDGKPQSSLTWAVSPTIGIFFDDALNSGVVLPTGDTVNGSVWGVTARVSAAVSPGLSKNRWQLAASGQITEAINRSAGRMETFEDTSRKFAASLSYALTDDAYIGQKKSNRIIPAVALVYTNGSDSLRGKKSQDTLELALTLLY